MVAVFLSFLGFDEAIDFGLSGILIGLAAAALLVFVSEIRILKLIKLFQEFLIAIKTFLLK